MTNAVRFVGATNAESWTLTYDEDNRTTSIHWDAGLSAKHILNRYDALGRRISKTVDGVTTGYVLSLVGGMERILCDLDNSGAVTAWYVHGPDLCYRVDAANNLVCFHADAMANIISLSGTNGTNLAQYAYTPYGRSLGSTSISDLASPISNPFTFVGSQGVMEELPGLYFMRARYYSADAGVFLSTDPVKHIGATWKPHAHTYANANPNKWIDPDGRIFGSVGSWVSSVVNRAVAFAVNVVNSIRASAGIGSSSSTTATRAGSGSAVAQYSNASSTPSGRQNSAENRSQGANNNANLAAATSSRSSGINPLVTGYSTTTRMLTMANGLQPLLRPVEGNVSSSFGWRIDPLGTTTQNHTGVDIAGRVGTPVAATYQGAVVDVGYKKEPGNFVIIDHGNGVTTRYYHMATTTVHLGQEVETGFPIGERGNTGTRTTGPHLHFEIRTDSNIDNLWNMTGGRGIPMEPPF